MLVATGSKSLKLKKVLDVKENYTYYTSKILTLITPTLIDLLS